MKRALILGVTGQDGSYLADYLLSRGYQVHGLYRRTSTGNTKNIEHIRDQITLHQGDLSDVASLQRIIEEVKPDEIYNEADQDNVGWSYSSVGYSCEVTASAVGRVLEVIRLIDTSIKYFQPCTAMMFGPTVYHPQDERTKFNPMSPYACAKVMAYHLCRFYRDYYGMFVCTGIFYNHDSVRRTEDYLLHKIAASAVRIAKNKQDILKLGDLDTEVDIGYAPEYMVAAHHIMHAGKPDDFIVGSGCVFPIHILVETAFQAAGVKWDAGRVVLDPHFKRPEDGTVLMGDNAKIRKELGWKPVHHARSLVEVLVDHYQRIIV